MSEMGKSIAQVTDTSLQLETMTTNYKDTHTPDKQHVVQSSAPLEKSQPDPKVLRDPDRNSRQALIDTWDDKLLNPSLT
jgi:hypothetical protein